MSGVSVTKRNDWADTLLDAAFAGAVDLMEHGLALANDDAPIEEGTLVRSGQVSSDRQTLTVQASYDTPYAVVQHEDQTLRHDDGRKAKYLEDNMLGPVASQAESFIGNRVRAVS